MKKWIVLAALAAPLAMAGCSHQHTYAYSPPPPPPPPPPVAANFGQIGYRDGFEAARRDVARQMPPNLRHHPNFRRPPVPPPAFKEYRRAFRAGYDAFLHNGPPPGSYQPNMPPPPPRYR